MTKNEMIKELVLNGYKKNTLLSLNKDELALLKQECLTMNVWTAAKRSSLKLGFEK